MSVHDPVDGGILVIEEWVSSATLDSAAKEFLEGNYDKIIVTGHPHDDEFILYENGAVQFDLKAAGVDWNGDDTVKVSLHASGEKVRGVYARYTVIHGHDTIGRGYTRSAMQEFSHFYPVRGEDPGMMLVVFDNDTFTRREDRNLHVRKLEVAGTVISVRSLYTMHLEGKGSNARENPLHYKTRAGEGAAILAEAGIDSSRIVQIGFPRTERLRTFTGAVAAGEWVREAGPGITAVNLVTEGNHARRSRRLYRAAMPAGVEVGVITFEPSVFDSRKRFFLTCSQRSNMYQLNAYVFTRIFFYPRLHYRRISKKIAGA